MTLIAQAEAKTLPGVTSTASEYCPLAGIPSPEDAFGGYTCTWNMFGGGSIQSGPSSDTGGFGGGGGGGSYKPPDPPSTSVKTKAKGSCVGGARGVVNPNTDAAFFVLWARKYKGKLNGLFPNKKVYKITFAQANSYKYYIWNKPPGGPMLSEYDSLCHKKMK